MAAYCRERGGSPLPVERQKAAPYCAPASLGCEEYDPDWRKLL